MAIKELSYREVAKLPAGQVLNEGRRRLLEKATGHRDFTDYLNNIHRDQNHSFPVHEWLESPTTICNGMKIKRRHIILYVAHRKGGVHYDPSSERAKDKEVYDFLEDESERARHMGKELAFMQLLCLGQQLAQSPDTDTFLEAARHVKRG